MPPRNDAESWHLDKKVPIAFIVAIAVQMGVWVWAISRLQTQVEQHDRRIVVLESTDQRMTVEAQRISEQLARFDERLQAQTAILRRVEEALRTYPTHPNSGYPTPPLNR